MERLSPDDAWFLYLEGPTIPLHVTGLLLLDPAAAPGKVTYEALHEHIDSRLGQLPRLRRRLVEVPLGIDHPGWIDDPDFSIENHVRRCQLPRSGHTALADFVGEFAGTPLDRGRPLWEMAVLEGLSDDRIGLLLKMHHCMVDGVSGMEILADLVDITPPPGMPPEQGSGPGVPRPGQVLFDATWNRIRTPLRPVRAALGASTSLLRTVERTIERRQSGAEAGASPLNAPRTVFNSQLTSSRSIEFASVPLAGLLDTKKRFAVPLNDVVLAACSHGLRHYLAEHGGVPDEPLICSIPISTHAETAGDASSNQLSTMFIRLPVHIADPVERLALIHADSSEGKKMQAAVGTTIIRDVVELIPTSLFRLGARLFSAAGMADRIAPVQNLTVSNVAGPREPLSIAGARVDAVYPFGPLMEGAGLNISVVSNNGFLNIGLIGCPDVLVDMDSLLGSIVDGVDVLARTSVPTKP